jgi:hypothetical protein
LETAWRRGLHALRPEDKSHIEADDTRRLMGSIDLDRAWQPLDPYGNRWDFGIAYQHSDIPDEFIYWVETHTASDHEVDRVIRKARWLLGWLGGSGKRLAQFKREIVWVSSGATTFTLTAPKKKQMAEAGLLHRGSRLVIRNNRGC